MGKYKTITEYKYRFLSGQTCRVLTGKFKHTDQKILNFSNNYVYFDLEPKSVKKIKRKDTEKHIYFKTHMSNIKIICNNQAVNLSKFIAIKNKEIKLNKKKQNIKNGEK